jgi:hypothetical protein
MKSAAVLLLLTVALATVAGAQTATSTQPVTIDGSVHPELIPDDAAAFAVFSVHSKFGFPATNANTEKHHAKIGLSTADHATYEAAMQMLHNNKSARAATFTNLLKLLSPDGQAKLKAFIQAEKRTMQFHRQEPIPQEVAQ